ncbi:CGNR zinc finger domain-containing protein [Actinoplanes aureus]|uniref:ABATE domain-containing protein n=1 Tax=Actinoplanes aureus TaxID=2792083 RepID=A0A931C9J3_9ACTN|nr:ABATE domain-containing protein [Actinoplanes aureus]MBG0565959.1 ABATE domain-containing protein [Actinoplanes aureus]
MGFPSLYGGLTCLDFANTVDGRALPEPEEHLHDYADLVRWAAYADLLDTETAHHLALLAKARPQAAAASYTAALRLREATFRLCAAPPAANDLALIQQGYAEAMSTATLTPAGTHYTWTLAGDHLDRAWWPAAVSAVELLTTDRLARVKVCASSGGCDGLFLDISKNGSRRWCDMGTCGVEAKISRQTARRRAARRTTP